MELHWTKDQIDSSCDQFLPLEKFEIDPLATRFFPPDSTIPNFNSYNGFAFVPCLRVDVYELLQRANNVKCLDWLSTTMNMKNLTFAEYAIALTKYHFFDK